MPRESNLYETAESFQILQSDDIEEADSRIIIHIFQSCYEQINKVFVLSSDTDVFVLLRHYWDTFKSKNLQVFFTHKIYLILLIKIIKC